MLILNAGSDRQMKLLRLLMIALLLQPCPVCWGHGLAGCDEAVSTAGEVCLAPASNCSCCVHTSKSAEIRSESSHDDHHDCPCICHMADQVFAPNAPVVPLISVTPLPGIVVNHDQDGARFTVLDYFSRDTSKTPLTLPLRL